MEDGIGYAVIADEGRTNVGSFTAKISLTSEHYVWSDGTTADRTFTYSITPATNTQEITPAYNATYGDLVKDIIKLPAGVQGTWSIEGVTEATIVGNVGTRTFKAIFTPDATGNYNGREETITIEIAKKSVPIPEVTKQEGVEYTGNKVSSGVQSTDFYTATDIGGVVVGTHKVQLTLKDKANYKWQDGDSNDLYLDYVTIIKAKNRDEIPTYTATYGDSLATLTPPTSATGSWKWETITEVGTVGGENKHKLVFTPSDTANYAPRTAEVTITVNPKKVTAPTEIPVANRNQVYTGEKLFSGLTADEGYTITEAENPVNKGTYTVTASLESANYIWSDGTIADKKLTYNIIPATNTEEITLTYTATYGDLLKDVITLPAGVQGTWSIEGATEATTVGNAGTRTFKAIFTPDATGNYNGREEEISITVAKKAVTVPTEYTKEYTYAGSDITVVIPVESGLYTVSGNVAKTVGNYTATLTLTDGNNYVWSNGDALTTTVPYSIGKADVAVSITINGWTYGQAANEPVVSISKEFVGDVPYTVEYSADGLSWSTAVPGDVDSYTVRVTVTDNANYQVTATSVTKATFTIEKAPVTRPTVTKQEGVEYTSNKVSSGVQSTDFYTATDIGGVVVGTHKVQLTLKDKANYKWQDGDSNDLYLDYVTIIKAKNRDEIPTYTATYGDSLATLTPPTSATGSWKWETITEVGTVGGENKHKLVFTPSDTANYAPRTAEVTITVNPKKVTAPTEIPVANRNQVYTGEKLFSGLTADEGYTITEAENPVNKGTYTVTASLESANYIWSDGTIADKKLTYNIIPATNTEEITLTYTATYGDLLKDVITLPAGVQGTWSIEGATEATTVGNAGTRTFKAIFTPDATGNYNGREEEISITVAKKAVTVPTEYTKEYTYAGSDITVVIPVESGLYTVSGNVAKTVGNYTATLTLTDGNNYVWSNGDALTTTVPYSIGKADVAVSITINGWTYGQAANEPVVSISKEFVGDVPYTVEYSADGLSWSTAVPGDVDSYTVRVTVTDNANYQVTTTSVTKATFTIDKVSTSITANETYTFTYNGSAHTTQALNISAPYAGAPALKYTYEDGSEFTGVTNAGEYKVVITLAETDTHKGATVTVAVKVEKADVTVSKPAIEGWTYAQSAKNPTATATYKDANGNDVTFGATLSFVYATSINGEYTATVPANAGTYYVKAVFAGNDNLNKAESEAQSFTIAKIVVPVPSIANKDYNGQVQYSGLVSDLYTVTEAENPLNVGDYIVTLTLNTPANYAWTSTDNTSETATVTYSINTVENTISVSIANNAQWQYGTPADVVNSYITVEVKYGGWEVAYRASGSTSEYTKGLPTKKGSYELKFTTTDTNCSIATATRSVEILATSVAVPTIGNLTYNTTLQKPTIPTGLYTVVNNGGTNVGEYTVTLKLLDPDSSYWDDDVTDVADKILTYQITKATVTLSGLAINSWNYNETASTPTVELNLSVPYYFEYFADGAWSTTVPTKVGSYKVRAVVDNTDNYDAVTTDEVEFAINQVTPTWSEPTFTGGKNNKYYLNQFGYPAASTLTATHANAADAANRTVSGTFTWGAPTFVANGGGYIELTFTPTDANYKTVTTKYDINFVTVAVIDSTEYGSIESALKDAISGKTVRVLPHDADLGPIYIVENVEIISGVTLLLPYGANSTDKNTYSNDVANFTMHGKYDKCSNSNHSFSSGLAGEELCIVKVIVAQNVTITNKGILEISGQLSGGGAGEQYAGHTGGKHARLLLDTNAIIDNYGVIRAAGFIREVEGSTGSQVIVNNGSKLYQPYVLKDYISGQYLAGPYKQMENGVPITPFNLFLLMNVSPTVRVNYGGSIITWAALYTGTTDGINTTKNDFIGKGGVIELTTEQSYLIAKYDPDTQVCKLDIFGGAQMNSMKLSVNLTIKTITVDTKDCLFPFTCFYDVTLYNGNYEMNQRIKMMPGAKLTVAQDAKLSIDTLIVYDETFKDERAINAIYLYPANKGAAVFTVNGSVTCNTLAGKVTSTTEGATVTVKSAITYTALEPKTYTDGTYMYIVPSQDIASTYDITKQAQLMKADKTSYVQPTVGSTSMYINGTWGTVLAVHFNANGGDEVSSITILDSEPYPTLPTPTRAHYTFAGWKDADGNIVSQGSALPSSWDAANGITLTAQWTPQPYTLNFNFKYEGWEAGSEPANTLPDAIQFDIETGAITLPTPTGTGTFVGWYKDAACTELIISISGADLIEFFGGNATIYGLWTSKQFTIKFENDHYNDVPYDNDTVTYAPAQLPTASLPAIPDSYRTDVTENKYFIGWYYNGQPVTDFSFIDTSASGEYTLTAEWATKFTVVFKYGDTVKGTYYLTKDDQITTPADDMTGWESGSAGGYYLVFHNWSNSTYGNMDAATAYKVPEAATDVSAVIEYSADVTKSAYVYNAVTVTVDSHTKITVTGGSWKKADGTDCSAPSSKGTYYLLADPSVTISVTTTSTDTSNYEAKLGLNGVDPTTTTTQSKTADLLTAITTSTNYIGDTCFTPDTLIMLADGSQKRVDELTADDKILAWDFFTGTYVAKDISLLVNHGEDLYSVANLVFSDGTMLRLIGEHGVFDYDLNKYIYFTVDNMEEYIGHRFVQYAADGTYNLVTLVEAYETEEYTSAWSVSSAITSNAFASGLLTVAPPEDFYNWIEMDGKLMYDVEQFQKDVETYGLYTYEDFKDYVTYDQFIEWNGAYLKIAVEKGYFTFEYILELIELYKGWMPNN